MDYFVAHAFPVVCNSVQTLRVSLNFMVLFFVMLLMINLFAIEFIDIQYLCIIGHDQISRTCIDHHMNCASKLDFAFAMCHTV